MRIKSYFTILLAIILFAAIVFEIKSIAEFTHTIGACKKYKYYANAKYECEKSTNAKNTEIIDNNRHIMDLCGCVKFSTISQKGNCIIMRNDNRILTYSLKYSAPVYYSYTCSVNEIHFTEKECLDKARSLVSNVIPDGISGCIHPEILNSASENFIVSVRLYFPGKENRIITVRIRRDTCHPVYFDARQIFGVL